MPQPMAPPGVPARSGGVPRRHAPGEGGHRGRLRACGAGLPRAEFFDPQLGAAGNGLGDGDPGGTGVQLRLQPSSRAPPALWRSGGTAAALPTFAQRAAGNSHGQRGAAWATAADRGRRILALGAAGVHALGALACDRGRISAGVLSPPLGNRPGAAARAARLWAAAAPLHRPKGNGSQTRSPLAAVREPNHPRPVRARIGSRLGAGMSARRWSERAVGATVFPAWALKEHRGYARFRRELERTQYWEPAHLAELQQRRLLELVRHAESNCRFYRERFREAGIEWAADGRVQGWERIPPLTKREIQDHRLELAADPYPAKDRIGNQTGGSTGSPLQFLVDRRRMATRMASTHRHNAWAGMRPGDWVAQLWGARLDEVPTAGWWAWCRQHALHRLLFFNTAQISDQNWESYLVTLRKHRPRFLLAYARSAAALAEHVLARGLTDIRFEAVITTAEVLLPEHRQQIEAAFGGKVFNRY